MRKPTTPSSVEKPTSPNPRRPRLLVVDNEFISRIAITHRQDIGDTFDTVECENLDSLKRRLEADYATPDGWIDVAVLDYDDQNRQNRNARKNDNEIALGAVIALKEACDRTGAPYPAVYIYSGIGYGAMNAVVDKARTMGFRPAHSVQKPNIPSLMNYIFSNWKIEQERRQAAVEQDRRETAVMSAPLSAAKPSLPPVTLESLLDAFAKREAGAAGKAAFLTMLSQIHSTEWMRPFCKTVAIKDGDHSPFAQLTDTNGDSISGCAVFSTSGVKKLKAEGKKGPFILFTQEWAGPLISDLYERPCPVQAVVQIGPAASHFKQVARAIGLSCLMIDPCHRGADYTMTIDPLRGVFTAHDPQSEAFEVKTGDSVTLDTNTGRLYQGKHNVKDGVVPDGFDEMTDHLVQYARRRTRSKLLDFAIQLDAPPQPLVAPGTRVGLHRTENQFLCKRTRGALIEAICKPSAENLAVVREISEKHLMRMLAKQEIGGITLRLMDIKPDQLFHSPEEEARVRALLPEGTALRGFMPTAMPGVYAAQIDGAFRALPKLLKGDAGVTFAVPMTKSADDIKTAYSLVQAALCGKSAPLPFSIGATIEGPLSNSTVQSIVCACADTHKGDGKPSHILVGTNDYAEALLGVARNDEAAITAWLEASSYREHPFREMFNELGRELARVGAAVKADSMPPTHLSLCGEHAAVSDNLFIISNMGFDGVSVPAHPLYTRGLRAAHIARLAGNGVKSADLAKLTGRVVLGD